MQEKTCQIREIRGLKNTQFYLLPSSVSAPNEIQCAGENQHPEWFVLRDLRRANANVTAYMQLRQEGHEVFTPLHSVVRQRQGRKVRMEVPFIHDLLFMRGIREQVDAAIAPIPTLQYRYQRGAGYCRPMVVRDEEMQRFIRFVELAETPKYYRPDELTPSMKGRKARIIGGSFDGFEGVILSVRGSRKRQLILELLGLFSVGVEIDAEYVQLI